METARKLSAKALQKREAARKKLRVGLAEIGYFIFPLARRRRHHRLDFVAVGKERGEFFLIRLARNGMITIQPYCMRSQHPKVSDLVKELREAGHPLRWLQQISLKLRQFRTNIRLEHFLSTECSEEYQKLTAQNKPAGV